MICHLTVITRCLLHCVVDFRVAMPPKRDPASQKCYQTDQWECCIGTTSPFTLNRAYVAFCENRKEHRLDFFNVILRFL